MGCGRADCGFGIEKALQGDGDGKHEGGKGRGKREKGRKKVLYEVNGEGDNGSGYAAELRGGKKEKEGALAKNGRPLNKGGEGLVPAS